MVGGCEEKEEEEEEKTWLDLYVYYTTQYRKDNLLLYIVVTRDVFHFPKFELNCLASTNTAKPNHHQSSAIIFHHHPSSIKRKTKKKSTRRRRRRRKRHG